MCRLFLFLGTVDIEFENGLKAGVNRKGFVG